MTLCPDESSTTDEPWSLPYEYVSQYPGSEYVQEIKLEDTILATEDALSLKRSRETENRHPAGTP